MKLPRFDLPNYETKLPVSGTAVKFRPYNVKEEKILLMAMQGEDPADMQMAIKQIVENCSSVKVAENHPVDVEWLFLQIRSCSVSSIIEVEYTVQPGMCGKKEGAEYECPATLSTGIDINSVSVIGVEDMEKLAIRKNGGWVVKLTDDIGMMIKLRTLVDKTENALFECTESIYEGDNILSRGDFSLEEFNEFIDSIPKPIASKLTEFLETQPFTKAEVHAKCNRCKKEFNEPVVGIVSFLV